MGLDYKAAGVDKEAGYQQVNLIKDMVKRTFSPQVITEVGGFSGMVELDTSDIKRPVLVSGTDGVGTKLKIAQEMDIHDTIGIDLVAMCVNDIICQGARPLFFLDYIATGKLIPEKMATIVKGVTDGCLQAEASLIGGETAEMPGMYAEDEYDLAGFAVGVVDKSKIISGKNIQAGDVAIGLPSSGVHSNGFSLVRAILEKHNVSFNDKFKDSKQTVGEVLLTPTKIYAKEIQHLIANIDVKGISHITGGGLYENLPRILPEGFGINIDTTAIPQLEVFAYLQALGEIKTKEMYNTFNMGVGMVVVVAEEAVAEVLANLKESEIEGFVLGAVSAEVEGVQLS